MNITFIKRRYFDFRQGTVTLAPIIQFSNFLMLAYLTISEYIPFYIFVPLFIISILLSFTVIGSKFRKIQFSTDINMGYEKSTEAAKTVVQMMLPLKMMMIKQGIDIPDEFEKRLEYMKDIGDGKI